MNILIITRKVTKYSYYARQRIEQVFYCDDRDEQILKLIKA